MLLESSFCFDGLLLPLVLILLLPDYAQAFDFVGIGVGGAVGASHGSILLRQANCPLTSSVGHRAWVRPEIDPILVGILRRN